MIRRRRRLEPVPDPVTKDVLDLDELRREWGQLEVDARRRHPTHREDA